MIIVFELAFLASELWLRLALKSMSCRVMYADGSPAGDEFSGRPLPSARWHVPQARPVFPTSAAGPVLRTTSGIGFGWSPGNQSTTFPRIFCSVNTRVLPSTRRSAASSSADGGAATAAPGAPCTACFSLGSGACSTPHAQNGSLEKSIFERSNGDTVQIGAAVVGGACADTTSERHPSPSIAV